MGEGEGGGEQENLVPPPLNPLPRGEGRFSGDNFLILEMNSQT